MLEFKTRICLNKANKNKRTEKITDKISLKNKIKIK